MNRLHALLLVFFVTLSAMTHSFAGNAPTNTYIVSMTQDSEGENPDDPPLNMHDEPKPHRVPPRPIICTISNDGIDIPNYTSADIISYEVYTTDGICIASFTTEQEFVDFIYSTSGTIEIRLYIEDSVYQGYLTL